MGRKTRGWQDVNKEDIPIKSLISTFEPDNRTHYSPNTYRWFTQRLTVFRKWLEDGEDSSQSKLKDFIPLLINDVSELLLQAVYEVLKRILQELQIPVLGATRTV